MRILNHMYVNGEWIIPQGTETFITKNPTTGTALAEVTLGNASDVDRAVAAAKDAWNTFSNSTKESRIALLLRLHDALALRKRDFIDTMVQEYGGILSFVEASFQNALDAFSSTATLLQSFDFDRTIGVSQLRLEAVGVTGIITPWNASNSFICSKTATAIAAGCTVVIKPSELSGLQTQLMMEVFDQAAIPAGVVNIVNGVGAVVGDALTRHKDIAKISFTGSTLTGKTIARAAVDTMKRVTLELGGKSPNIILSDADFSEVIPMAVYGAFMNNGQACIAPTRLLVPKERLEEVNIIAKATAATLQVGNPADAQTHIGPMVSQQQFERVQNYINLGMAEDATLLTGGVGKPKGLEEGHFVKATIFTDVRNEMRIAQEEIFGPVLAIIPYTDEADAVRIANDTMYGLAAYVSSGDLQHAQHIAAQIAAGRVCINGFSHDPMAPFGGYKQSGIGREYGVYGLESYLEPKAILTA